RRGVDDRLERLAEQLDRVLQVDDVNAVAGAEDELLHLRVPPAGVVSEVHARLEQGAHADGVLPRRFCHRFHVKPPLVATQLVVDPGNPEGPRPEISELVSSSSGNPRRDAIYHARIRNGKSRSEASCRPPTTPSCRNAEAIRAPGPCAR